MSYEPSRLHRTSRSDRATALVGSTCRPPRWWMTSIIDVGRGRAKSCAVTAARLAVSSEMVIKEARSERERRGRERETEGWAERHEEREQGEAGGERGHDPEEQLLLGSSVIRLLRLHGP